MKKTIAAFLAFILALLPIGQAESNTEIITAELEYELDDPELIEYLEEQVYSELLTELGSADYFVENVTAVYYSKEFLETLAANSRENIYFGYTISELEAAFKGEKYVFTLGEDGETIVRAFEEYDDTYEEALKNIAIGTGVIFLCVTVSVVTAGSAHAISLIFAASAKTGAICAASSGVFSAATAGVVTGMQTNDIEEALKAAAISGSEAFAWGAIGGAVSGGLSETSAIYGATRNGLTMNEAAQIQMETKLPLEFIKNFHSVDEYNVYKAAQLTKANVNGEWAFVRGIDWDFVGPDGKTNAERVIKGVAPLDSNGQAYELHHIGQKKDSPLAILTSSEHHGNHAVLHKNAGGATGSKPNQGVDWDKRKRNFWLSYYEMCIQ